MNTDRVNWLVAACLILGLAWIAAGSPRHARTIGSFEEWSHRSSAWSVPLIQAPPQLHVVLKQDRLAAVILAAGCSRRMEGANQLLSRHAGEGWGGVPHPDDHEND
ncbi:hypothetical protein WCLP8_1430056 [uncultured Gammaproteobacteria bacterium]